MTFELIRRDFIKGLAGIIAFASAPAIIRSSVLMPVKVPPLVVPVRQPLFLLADGDLGPMENYGSSAWITRAPVIYKALTDGPYNTGRVVERVILTENGFQKFQVAKSFVPK